MLNKTVITFGIDQAPGPVSVFQFSFLSSRVLKKYARRGITNPLIAIYVLL
jgi:hypothetical protein